MVGIVVLRGCYFTYALLSCHVSCFLFYENQKVRANANFLCKTLDLRPSLINGPRNLNQRKRPKIVPPHTRTHVGTPDRENPIQGGYARGESIEREGEYVSPPASWFRCAE